MFPSAQDRKNYSYPEDGLSRPTTSSGAEMRTLNNSTSMARMPACRENGLTTGTTLVASTASSPLERFTRTTVQSQVLELLSYPRQDARQVFRWRRLGFGRPRQGGSHRRNPHWRLRPLTKPTSLPHPYWWVKEQVRASSPAASLRSRPVGMSRARQARQARRAHLFPLPCHYALFLFSRLVLSCLSHHTRPSPVAVILSISSLLIPMS